MNKIAKRWLEELVRSANTGDYETHMDLISKRVNVIGIPGFDAIGYDEWARQRKHEFEQGLLKRLSYDGTRMVTNAPSRVMFQTVETMEGADGTRNRQGMEIILQQEEDGKWRVLQERVLPRRK